MWLTSKPDVVDKQAWCDNHQAWYDNHQTWCDDHQAWCCDHQAWYKDHQAWCGDHQARYDDLSSVQEIHMVERKNIGKLASGLHKCVVHATKHTQ